MTESYGELASVRSLSRTTPTLHSSKKEYEQDEIDRDARTAKSTLENLETSLVNVKSEIAAKQKEARGK